MTPVTFFNRILKISTSSFTFLASVKKQRLKQIQDHLNFWKILGGSESFVIIFIDSGSEISSIVKHYFSQDFKRSR